MNIITNLLGSLVGSCVASTTIASGRAIIQSIPSGRSTHASLLVFVFAIAWALYIWSFEIFSFISEFKKCDAASAFLVWKIEQGPTSTNSSSSSAVHDTHNNNIVEDPFFIPACYGALSVYRIFFAFVVHQIIHMIAAAGGCSTDGAWTLRFLLYVGLAIISFFLPNQIFIVYSWISIGSSILFAISQLSAIVDAVDHKVTVWLSESRMLLLQIVMFISYASILILVIVIYAVYNDMIAVILMSVNVLFVIIAAVLSTLEKIHESNDSVGILQAAAGSFIATLILVSAIVFGPSQFCSSCDNTFRLNGFSSFVLVMEFLIAMATVLSLVYYETSKCSDDDEESADKSEVEKDEQRAMFHFFMAIGASYLCLILTEWLLLTTTADDNGTKLPVVKRAVWIFWVRAASSWAVIAVYIWTMIAPFLFPGRTWR